MGLGEKVKATILDTLKDGFSKVIGWIEKPAVDFILDGIAKGTLPDKLMVTPEMKKQLKELKKKWSSSPQSIKEIGIDLLEILVGAPTKVQMEGLIGKQITTDQPTMLKLFAQMAYVTDINLLSNEVGFIGSLIPFVNADNLGAEMRAYLDYSGLTQITGFGYGQLLATGIGPQLRQEIRTMVQGDILDQGTIRLLHMREIIHEEGYNTELAKWGWNEERRKAFLLAGQYYPVGQDFIRYAVRDVFNPVAVETGKLMDNFPKDIIPYAKKAGMSKEILEWEWMSHWQLPSPRMGYEMLHRGFINKTGLEDLLRISDYAPGWIDNMIGISYSPLTRVDARRFYETGVLNDAGYMQAMKDIGYSDHNAKLYVEWAKRRMADPDRDLTKAQVMSAYRLGLMTRLDTTKFLVDLGYDEAETDLIISLSDEKERLSEIKDELANARYEYVHGTLTKDEFFIIVDKLGLPITQVTKEFIKADRARRKGIKIPSKEDVLKWFEDKTIDAKQARDKLRQLGYRENDIEMYLGTKI